MKRDKVIHFFSKHLRRKLTRKELTDLKGLMSGLHISRKKLTPFITGYLMAIRPDDPWLLKTVKGTFNKQSTRTSSTKLDVKTQPGKESVAKVEKVQSNHKTGVQDESRTQLFPKEKATVAAAKQLPRGVSKYTEALRLIRGCLQKDPMLLVGPAFASFQDIRKEHPQALLKFLKDLHPGLDIELVNKVASPDFEPHIVRQTSGKTMVYYIFV
jgi:hypothetical protein